MSKSTTLSLAALAVVTAFAASSALRAQETPGSATPQRPGMMDKGGMMGGDMSGMMNMMRQMSQMMDQCSRMMQSMTDRPGSKSPDQPPK